MSDHILLGTRKGTLILDRKAGRWTPRPIAHPGVSVSYAARGHGESDPAPAAPRQAGYAAVERG